MIYNFLFSKNAGMATRRSGCVFKSGNESITIMKKPCDESVRKNFRVMSNALLGMLIFAAVGVAISILMIINMAIGHELFPFSAFVDPPYLGIICVVVLALAVVVFFQLNRLKHKTCDAVEGPFL